MTDCVLSGTLSLGQDLSWQGENVLTDFCLYTDESTESSAIVDVDFKLEAITDLTAIKLFMFQRHRWKAGIIESIHSGFHGFLKGLFDQGTNISGTTKKALIISVVNSQQQQTIPSLKIGSKLIIYGEKMDSKLYTFVHPVYDTQDFLSIYEPSTYQPQDTNHAVVRPILDEIFGGLEHAKDDEEEELLSSAQILPPHNIIRELELIERINQNNGDRDLIGEFKNAAEERIKLIKEKKRQQQQSIRISKSKPVKYNSHMMKPLSTLDEKKNTVKMMIKETLPDTTGENKTKFQLIYSSIRTICQREFESSKPLDETKLRCIIKLHVDFYNNLETINNIFHPPDN